MASIGVGSGSVGAQVGETPSFNAGRRVGPAQGWSLMSTSWVATVAVVGIAPVLPQIAAAFAGTPGLDVKIGLIATLPSLGVALLALPYGALADRIGRRGLLIGAILFYGLVGMAPIWLRTLDSIVIARALVGVAEAAIMTCGTAMFVDLFHGESRARWLALGAGFAPILATLFLILAGFLGQYGWRAPFAAYGISLVLLPLILLFTWEPQRSADADGIAAASSSRLDDFRWSKQIWVSVVTIFAMIGFVVTLVQAPFLLTARGVTASGEIGMIAAGVSIATPIGALTFSLVRWRVGVKLLVAFALFAVGCATMALLPSVVAVVVGALIANLGGGLVLPTCITWALAPVPADKRGMASGLFQGSLFLGQFSSPLVILGLSKVAGGLNGAVLCYGVAAALAAGLSSLSLARPTPVKAA